MYEKGKLKFFLLFFLSFFKTINVSENQKNIKERSTNLKKKKKNSFIRNDLYLKKFFNRITPDKLFCVFWTSSLNKTQRERIQNEIEKNINYINIVNFIYFLDIMKKREQLNEFIERVLNKIRIDQLEYILKEKEKYELKNYQVIEIENEIRRTKCLIRKGRNSIIKENDKLICIYNKKEEVEWIEKEKDIIINTENKFVSFYYYATKILMKLKTEKIKFLRILCDSEDQIDWTEQIPIMIKIEEIGILILYMYATKILLKLDIKTIKIFFIDCYSEDQIDWIEKITEIIQIKEIRKIELHGFSIKLLTKKCFFSNIKKLEKIVFTFYKQEELNPLLKLKETEIKNEDCEVYFISNDKTLKSKEELKKNLKKLFIKQKRFFFKEQKENSINKIFKIIFFFLLIIFMLYGCWWMFMILFKKKIRRIVILNKLLFLF